MQTSTHHSAAELPPSFVAMRPVSLSKLAAILRIEYRTVRSANHPGCDVSEPRYRNTSDPMEANWEIDPPRECPDGCHLLISMVAADLATRYRLERRAKRRG